MQQWKENLPSQGGQPPKTPVAQAGKPKAPVYSPGSSPFANTLAHIRLQVYEPKRESLLRQSYAPYFHTTHISMRNQDGSETNYTTPERDYWYSSGVFGYPPVANTMKLLLADEENTATGLLYFSAGEWISPLQFANMDFDKIWYLAKDDSPEHVCMTKRPEGVDAESTDEIYYRRAEIANKAIVERYKGRFDVDTSEVCYGRSDLYYIPRRFWADFIDLSNMFYSSKAFNRVTIATILRILDRTHQRQSQGSMVSELEDCWVECCGIRPEKEQILTYRCGRTLDWANGEEIAAHFNRLKKDADTLKKTS